MDANRSYAGSNVVNTNLKGYRTGLNDFSQNMYGIPISVFRTKNSNIYNDIENAIEYLKVIKDGAVRIPANSDNNYYNAVVISSSIDRQTYETKINYSTTNYCHPTIHPRPYTGDNWEIGDVVYNNDFTRSNCSGWVCIESGTPGKWLQFGHAKNWSSTAESVDEVPEACESQLGRIIIHNNAVYCCTVRDNVYFWSKLNISLFGSRDQRPNQPNELYPGLPYFNTDTGLPEFWDGTRWNNFNTLNQDDRDRLLKLEQGLSELTENYNNYIQHNNQTINNIDETLLAIHNSINQINQNISDLSSHFNQYSESTDNALRSINESIDSINQEISSIKDDTQSLHEDINNIDNKITKVPDTIIDSIVNPSN